jgi:hypothetical protein
MRARLWDKKEIAKLTQGQLEQFILACVEGFKSPHRHVKEIHRTNRQRAYIELERNRK